MPRREYYSSGYRIAVGTPQASSSESDLGWAPTVELRTLVINHHYGSGQVHGRLSSKDWQSGEMLFRYWVAGMMFKPVMERRMRVMWRQIGHLQRFDRFSVLLTSFSLFPHYDQNHLDFWLHFSPPATVMSQVWGHYRTAFSAP